MENETYLGDAVYASYDGWQIKLYAAFVVWVFATDADVRFLCGHEVIEHG